MVVRGYKWLALTSRRWAVPTQVPFGRLPEHFQATEWPGGRVRRMVVVSSLYCCLIVVASSSYRSGGRVPNEMQNVRGATGVHFPRHCGARPLSRSMLRPLVLDALFGF